MSLASRSQALRLSALSAPRTQCLYASRRVPQALLGQSISRHGHARTQIRTVVSHRGARSRKYEERPVQSPKLQEREQRLRSDKKKLGWYFIGFVGCLAGIATLARQIGPSTREADAGDDAQATAQRDLSRKVVVLKPGETALPEDNADVVETGHSVVPTFPRTIEFPDKEGTVEYRLLGVGVRYVSFLSISVYVGGVYVAQDDIDRLEHILVKKINPIATTLVAGEKTQLKELLLNHIEGEQAWNEILKEAGVRSVIRIVPVRDTDFHHLRDGWVRGITARATQNKQEFGDEQFGESLNAFKAIFNKGSVKKQRILAFSRDASGQLDVWFDNGKDGLANIGTVKDERVSRAIWLNYLAGKAVASDTLRKSVIDGVMECVERPVGTQATQVHV